MEVGGADVVEAECDVDRGGREIRGNRRAHGHIVVQWDDAGDGDGIDAGHRAKLLQGRFGQGPNLRRLGVGFGHEAHLRPDGVVDIEAGAGGGSVDEIADKQ